jgi:hypothetical protein
MTLKQFQQMCASPEYQAMLKKHRDEMKQGEAERARMLLDLFKPTNP